MWTAHLLTLSRIPLAIAFWFVVTRPALALAVIAIAAATDLVDGTLARRASGRGASRRAVELGAWLDPLCDKTFAIVVLAALLLQLHAPVVIVALIGVRELVLVPLVLIYRLTPLHHRFRNDYHSLRAGKLATIAQFMAVIAVIVGAQAWPWAVLAAVVGLYAAARYVLRTARASTRSTTQSLRSA